ncbi:MAG TPA: copper homeostasis protein CutC [Firmicutes bacterium]|nr:copper homeostasis protein CutC [Bacillota bacterium]
MSVLVEVVCFSIEDVYRAKEGGAGRVELCADPGAGGTTPSYGLIKASVALGIQTAVMIRPRGGDFYYTPEEIAVMEEDIRIAAKLGAEAVVFGVLDADGALDSKTMSRLAQLSKSHGLEITCHRAFDVAGDPKRALQVLLDLEFDRLLTSGQQKTALEGMPLLKELIQESAGRISIMPGGGVRPKNVSELLQLDITEIHTGSKTKVPSRLKKRGSEIKIGADDAQESHYFVDTEAIKQIVAACQGRR